MDNVLLLFLILVVGIGVGFGFFYLMFLVNKESAHQAMDERGLGRRRPK